MNSNLKDRHKKKSKANRERKTIRNDKLSFEFESRHNPLFDWKRIYFLMQKNIVKKYSQQNIINKI
jgi:hypothetical protein